MAKSGQIIFPVGDAPETPQSGKVTLYGKDNKALYYKDDTGAEYPLSASGVLSVHGNLEGLDADDHTQYLLRTDFYTYSGTLQSDIDAKPDTLIELTDTPSAYDDGKYLQSTAGGTVWATVSAGGSSNHSELNELDYASAGHTGFASTAALATASGDIVSQIPTDYVSDSEMTTISGDIVSQIPSLSGYATESYVDTSIATASGDIVSQIPSLTGYATEAYVTTVSGDIVSQIPSLAGYATEVYVDNSITTVSGDIVSQIPTDYITEEELTTTSGDIVSQIVTDHNNLNNLDYASAGHTGFASYQDLITLSGTLAGGIHGSEYDTAESESESSTSLTTYQTKISITKGQTEPAGTYRLGWVMDYNGVSANKDIYVRMYNLTDGLTYSENHIKSNYGTAWYTFAGIKSVVLSGSDKTFQLQYRAGTSSCSVRNARIEIWRME